MKWIVLIKLILDIISKMENSPKATDDTDQEALVRDATREVVESSLASPAEVSAQFGDWEELIEHIVAIIMFFIRRNTPQV
jgi:hypothetical protein